MNAMRKQKAAKVANHPGTWITLATGVISYFITQFGGDKVTNISNSDKKLFEQVNSNIQINEDLSKDRDRNLNKRVDQEHDLRIEDSEEWEAAVIRFDKKLDKVVKCIEEMKDDNNLTTIENDN